jgi:hypothetical protein
MRHTLPLVALCFSIIGLFALTGPTAHAQSTQPSVVISQVYGGGGNSGAEYTHDFIELFNQSESPVLLVGWSVQYASANGANWQLTELTGTIPPGGYYLIQQAQGNGGRRPLPTPDATGAIPMSASSGKVVLLSQVELLARGTSCPEGAAVVDLFGFGGADCFAGASSGPGLDNRNAALRLDDGCEKSGDNGSDFVMAVPSPRNSASTPRSCDPSLEGDPTTASGPLPVTTTLSLRQAISASVLLPPTPALTTTQEISGASPVLTGTAEVRISQIYGGGGNGGATYTHDFVELHNPGPAAVKVDGWSFQYASATGKTWLVTPLTGTIGVGEYYLIQQAQGNGGTVALSAPDATGETAMSASSGKVALVQGIEPLSGSCPSGAAIIDFVGYGSANCFEGGAPAPRPSNARALHRIGADGQDTDDNREDFVTSAPNPRQLLGGNNR